MKYGGIIVAVVVIAGLGIYVSLLMSSMGDEIESLRAENERLRHQLDALASQENQIAAMEAEVKELMAKVRDADAALRSNAEAPPETGAVVAPETVAPDVAMPAKSEDDEENSESPIAGMMKMFQGEEGKKMREASARMTVDMQYASLLKDLALPADVDKQVRDILMASAMSQIEQGMSIMEGGDGQSAKDFRAQEEAATAEVRAQLSEVLTADELAQWEEFEADKERHMMEQSYDMQLNMFGGSMDDDTRLILRDTLVEQMLLSQEQAAQSDEPMEVTDHLQQQQQAYDRTREAIAIVLTEEQYQQADRFLTQQEDMLQVSMEMMGDMFGSGDAEEQSEN